jgi:CheY-like chemotaxis protein
MAKKKLLIVEDDKNTQNIYKKIFSSTFKVEACDSDEGFFKLMTKNKFDVILMDISLKGLKDGLQLTREIKSSKDYKHIPVICLSAHAFPKDRENAFEAGVDDYLTKPVQITKLMEVLQLATASKN